ncbi:hypothetical protein NUU61_004247 [Penicillium alfredii]|uniref:Uncharacterized protein n=1 Tax=Penicillium alfredii TaxID=1506179 RepID=A0A9W9FKV1_9EURO|nr:uncharacterized protein NUU61_004247 [Penicillium alfredii]KAJ5102025.1 hypothetical protein NUU61_004247 [Penicillium alfredii]
MSPTALTNVDTVDIVDIRKDNLDFSLVDDIYKNLAPPPGTRRSFPTLLLYDAQGLKLFEKITYLDEYYLTNAEIDALKTHAQRIVERIPKNAQLVELGSGSVVLTLLIHDPRNYARSRMALSNVLTRLLSNLRKIEILLRECERVEKQVDYYALDLSLVELRRTFSEINPESFTHVGFHGLHGTYDDALDWLDTPANRTRPTVVMSMGSSIGNFDRPEATEFLSGFAKLLHPSDFMLIGLDACKTPEKVYSAYNDSQGITRKFYENGLAHANAVLGFEAFKPGEWDILTGYDTSVGRHQAWYSPKVDVAINGIKIPKGEKLVFEEAFKYGRDERDGLWRSAGLISQVEFGNSADNYHVHLLSPAALHVPMKPSQYAARPTPSLEDFQSLWAAWDIVTRTMIPREELWSKPIKLRNALIFYLGHIPTFFALREKPTKPKSYQQIFERGIDPDVEDPEQCHSHSEIPDEWPPLDEILDYQERVRNRARSILQQNTASHDRCLNEALWIGFEHEAMHLETFLYMLLQSDKALPPVGIAHPDFTQMAQQAKNHAKPNEWFRIPKQTLAVGLDDSDETVMPKHSFGWDNEKPQRTVWVHSFEAQARPITNGEYATYVQASQLQTWPASWTCIHSNLKGSISNGVGRSSASAADDFLDSFTVRTVFGPVPLKLAKDWPLVASYDEVASYAKWMECRIPTFEEVQSIYQYVDQVCHQESGHAANGHGYVQLSASDLEINITNCGTSNGVNEPTTNGIKPRSPVHQPVSDNSSQNTPVFRDLGGCNVGFQHWHPTPVTPHGDRLAGQGGLGGVWEWTSTPLMPHEGFKSMDIYPGYTCESESCEDGRR